LLHIAKIIPCIFRIMKRLTTPGRTVILGVLVVVTTSGPSRRRDRALPCPDPSPEPDCCRT